MRVYGCAESAQSSRIKLCSHRLMSVLVFQCMLVKNTDKTDPLETHPFKVVFANKCAAVKFYNLLWVLIAQEMFTVKRKSYGRCGQQTGKANVFIPVASFFCYKYIIRKGENSFPHPQNGTPLKAATLEIRQQDKNGSRG